MKRYILRGGTVVTGGDKLRVTNDCDIEVIDGRISKIGGSIEPGENDEIIDLYGKIILPGMINAHTHLYSAFARGLTIPEPQPEHFTEILRRLWWKLDRTLTPNDIHLSAMTGLLESISRGTTTLFDHHSSPDCIDGSLDIIAEAYNSTGARGSVCYEVSDRDGFEKAKAGIEENARFMRRLSKEPEESLVTAHFGLHACFTLSDRTIEIAVEKEKDARNQKTGGFHIHVAEPVADVEHSMVVHGMRPVERLAKYGVLGKRTLLAHGIHLVPEEWRLISESGSTVVHNPLSNMNNGVGAAPVTRMLEAGVDVALGTDALTSSLFMEIMGVHVLHKHEQHDPRVGWKELATFLLNSNPTLATRILGKPVGMLKEGFEADIIALDYNPPTPLDADGFLGHMVFGLTHAPVVMTMIAGKIRYLNGEFPGIDHEAVFAEARKAAGEFRKRFIS